MSFLNRSVLQERAAAATVEKHPLLKECDVPPNVKQAYLQGCVLAVLERDDGKVTDAARQELLKIGKSLELSDADCAEAISIVSALQTPEDQGQFLDELFPVLSGEIYPKFFMRDFQSLIAKGGQMTDDKKQTVDYFGKSLTGRADWLKVLETARQVSTDKRAQNYADVPLAYRSTADVVWAIYECPFHYELPDGSQISKMRDVLGVSSPQVRKIIIKFLEFSFMSALYKGWNKDADDKLKRKLREVIVGMGLDLRPTTIDGEFQIELPRTDVQDRLYVEGEREFAEGMKYYNGEGVSRDYQLASKYFACCLSSGCAAKADYMIATMRLEGKVRLRSDLEQERREALTLLRISAQEGYAPAVDLIKNMESSMPFVGDVLSVDEIVQGIAEAAGLPDATYDETLAELTLYDEDLLALLLGSLEDQFGIGMPEKEFNAARTVGDLVECIRNKKMLK